jgi:tetratricopeptide (TPR) repeat protein
MPGEPLPKQKLAEAQSLKAAWDSYNSIITAADDYYVNREFLLAKDKYLQAQAIKPEDEYPKRMLEKIDIALMDVEQANRSSYEFTIQRADELYSQQDYEKAMVEYRKALLFKPDETYAQQRINDINNALNLRNSQEEAYTQAISRADGMFKEENYTDAKAEYNKAIGIKPLEQYPKVKIEEINTILKDLSTKQELYTNLIKGADRLFFSDEYEEAREQYRQASYLFPKEEYPIDQITMINEILGQRDTYIKAVTRADQLFYQQDFEAALIEFRTASALQPDEAYPKEKILEIEALLADAEIDANDKRKALENYNKEQVYEVEEDAAGVAAMQVIEKQYWDLIASADAAMAVKDYQKALTDYEAARKLKPGEIYAQGKIAEIKPILADIAAKEIAAKKAAEEAELAVKEEAAKAEAAAIAAAEAALEKQYQEAITAGDLALKGNDYQQALSSYQAASSLKPQATYASDKIAEINATLAEIAAKEAAEEAEIAAKKAAEEAEIAAKKAVEEAEIAAKAEAAKAEAAAIAAAEAALEKQYQEAIAAGDLALKGNDYQQALSSYQAAASLKPQATYASEKILEVNTIIAEQVKQLELEQQYIKIIATADQYLETNNYEEARAAYKAAGELKPGESYPGKQILQIDHTLESMEAEREQAYQNAVTKAEISFEQKDYEMAKLQYSRVLELKPDDAVAQQKLKLVEEQIMTKRQLIQQEYDRTIIDADKFFTAKTYDNAIDSYRAASLLKPDEQYPKEMVNRILKLLTERSIVQINKEALLIHNNTTHKFEFNPVPAKDRKSNYIFFRARNVSSREYKLIISFGEGQSKNGGVVVKVPAGESIYEFVVRISAQYKWFSDDNNWISFYPEGGDIEVSLMQISYSD